jgi:hypothetical protein
MTRPSGEGRDTNSPARAFARKGQEQMKRKQWIKYRACGALLAAAVVAGIVSSAGAQMPGYNGNNQSQRIWGRMDACKREAWKAHPDYTREGRAKRDAAVRHCMEARGLPPAEPEPPNPTPPQRSGAAR